MAALRSLRLWKYEPLAHPIGLLWDSGLEKVQATPFQVPRFPAAVPHRCDLDELEHYIHEDDVRPVLFMQGHGDWINDVMDLSMCQSQSVGQFWVD